MLTSTIDLQALPSSLLTSGEFMGKVIDAMVQIVNVVDSDRSLLVDSLGDIKHLNDIDIDRCHRREVSLEGEIEMTPPHNASEIDRSSSYDSAERLRRRHTPAHTVKEIGVAAFWEREAGAANATGAGQRFWTLPAMI